MATYFDDPEVKVVPTSTTPVVEEEVSDTPYQRRKFKYNDYYNNTYLKNNPKANKRKYAKWYESDEGVAARKKFEEDEERKYQEWYTKWKAQEERKKATPVTPTAPPEEKKEEETPAPADQVTPVATEEEVFVEEDTPQAFDATTLHSYFSSPEQIKNWQKMNGLPETGVMDEASIMLLKVGFIILKQIRILIRIINHQNN